MPRSPNKPPQTTQPFGNNAAPIAASPLIEKTTATTSETTATLTSTGNIALQNKTQNKSAKEGDNKKATLTGMDRYVTVVNKRKRSSPPPQNKNKNNAYNNKENNKKLKTSDLQAPNNSNRFAPLASASDKEAGNNNQATKKLKPPPIYVRERSSNNLVAYLTRLVGSEHFYVVALTRGNVHETKVQVDTEEQYRTVVKELEADKKNFYTYQLKSSKGIVVVIKGIDADVDPSEIKDALGDLGFHSKSVINIINKNKVPQPMFKIELLPNSTTLKKNENHPIYKLQYLLHRRVTVEAPHPRNGPIQCANCQEFGHTKKYCSLRPVCVVCGELHLTSECDKRGKNYRSLIRCGNCNENHTANYRGCKVYQHFKQNISLQKQALRNHKHNPFITADSISHRFTSNPVTPGVSYANALKTNATNQQQKLPPQSTINLEAMLTQFMQTMQSMFDKITQMQTQIMTIFLAQK